MTLTARDPCRDKVPDAALAADLAWCRRLLEAEWGHHPGGDRGRILAALQRVQWELRRRAGGPSPDKPAPIAILAGTGAVSGAGR